MNDHSAANKDLTQLQASLEQQVQERTTELTNRGSELENAFTQIQRRAAQFKALAQVAQSISYIRDPQELMPRITSVISEFYGFYHVGVFLIDEFNEYAVLTAANSEGGKRMLARNHRLRVGEEGIVGNVTATGNPRISLDVGADAIYFGNPDLPDTHSEMAPSTTMRSLVKSSDTGLSKRPIVLVRTCPANPCVNCIWFTGVWCR